MKKKLGTIGWREFNQNRLNILNEYDRIKNITQHRPVKTAHGNAVEAFVRKWLSEYLPKKYGVTSGYVIPDVYQPDYKLYHYDLIIFNQIDSPVLWVEGNVDQSAQGKSLAIPAKHVSAIYEIKSTLNDSTAKDSINKLMSIHTFKDHLPKYFSSGSIFIELLEDQIKNQQILPALFEGSAIPGYWGGTILRCEVDTTMTGLFVFASLNAEDDEKKGKMDNLDLAKPIDDLKIYLTYTGNLSLEEQGAGASLVATSAHNWSVIKEYGTSYSNNSTSIMLNWSRSKFSEFAIQVVSCLEGIPYNSEVRPRYGQVFDNVKFKDVEVQPDKPQRGLPYLKVAPFRFKSTGSYMEHSISEEGVKIKCQYQVENIGDESAIITADRFKSEIEIKPGESKKYMSELVVQDLSQNKPISSIVAAVENGKIGTEAALELIYKTSNGRLFIKNVVYEIKWNKVRDISNK